MSILVVLPEGTVANCILPRDPRRLAPTGLGKLKRKSERRAISVSGIDRIDVGRDSAAFRSAPPNARGSSHLSLSLVMRPSHAIDGRETLDLCCADEEKRAKWAKVWNSACCICARVCGKAGPDPNAPPSATQQV